MFRTLLLSLVALFPFSLMAEEAFLLMNADNLQIVAQQGSESSIQSRASPVATFEIPLSLIGFDSDILKDSTHPEWPYLAYGDSSASCNKAQVPKTWIANSCIWYAQQLTKQLGMEKLQAYLTQFHYGNENLSGGLERAWLNSSLKISMFEQVAFLKRMLQRELLVSEHATKTTIELLYLETLKNGWNVYGKTGKGENPISKETLLWFVGWVEKGNKRYIFAYKNEGPNLSPEISIPRTEKLFIQSGVIDAP